MYLKIGLVLGLSVLAAILYRMGGAGRTGKWYDFLLNTKARDFGVPTCWLAALLVVCGWETRLWWAYILSWGALFGSLTTYWKKKGTDARWYHWVFVGLGFSVAALPFAFGDGSWGVFCLRLGVLTSCVALWSSLIGNAVVEELGRGFLIVITALLFLLRKKGKDDGT